MEGNEWLKEIPRYEEQRSGVRRSRAYPCKTRLAHTSYQDNSLSGWKKMNVIETSLQQVITTSDEVVAGDANRRNRSHFLEAP